MTSTRLKQALVALLGGALCLLMVFLGLWQMQVFESQASSTTAARAASPAVALEDNLYQGRVGDLYGRPVTLRGEYLPASQVLVGTGSTLRVVTAFRTVNARTVAVVRGVVELPQRVPAAPQGVHEITGLIAPTEPSSGLQSHSGGPGGTQPELRLEVLAQQWPSPLLDGYVTLAPSQPGGAGLAEARAVIPDTEGGKVRNRGYALQWWAFAIFGGAATLAGVRAVGRTGRMGAA